MDLQKKVANLTGQRSTILDRDEAAANFFDRRSILLETGKLLWESDTVEGAQILGVACHRVIVTVGGTTPGLRGLSVGTGSHREPGGWVQPTDRRLLGHGRGLVADDVILWPTRECLFFLRPEDGRQLRPPVPGQQGDPPAGDGAPDAGRPVGAGRDDAAAVGAERGVEDGAVVLEGG